MTYRENLLRKRLTELRKQLAEAATRGECAAYLAKCPFKIDEFEMLVSKSASDGVPGGEGLMPSVIIPANPGTKFVTIVTIEKGETWVKVENEVIAWRISDDGSEVAPIGSGGVRDPLDHSDPWIQHPDGTVEQPGSFDSFESATDAEHWLSRKRG